MQLYLHGVARGPFVIVFYTITCCILKWPDIYKVLSTPPLKIRFLLSISIQVPKIKPPKITTHFLRPWPILYTFSFGVVSRSVWIYHLKLHCLKGGGKSIRR